MELDVPGRLAGHVLDGETHRSISSTATGSIERSADSIFNWSGWRSSSYMPPLITCRWSRPRRSGSGGTLMIDASSNRSPSISAWTRVPIRSSDWLSRRVGRPRRRRTPQDPIAAFVAFPPMAPARPRRTRQRLQQKRRPHIARTRRRRPRRPHPHHVADGDHGQRSAMPPEHRNRPNPAWKTRVDAAARVAPARRSRSPARGEGLHPSATRRRRLTCSGASVSITREGVAVGPHAPGVGERVGVLRRSP